MDTATKKNNIRVYILDLTSERKTAKRTPSKQESFNQSLAVLFQIIAELNIDPELINHFWKAGK